MCRNGRTSSKRWSSCRSFATRTLSSIEDVTWRSTRHGYVSVRSDKTTLMCKRDVKTDVCVCWWCCWCVVLSWWWSTASARPRTSSKVRLTPVHLLTRDYFICLCCVWLFFFFSFPSSSQKAAPGNRNSCYYPWCTAGISISSLTQYDSQVNSSVHADLLPVYCNASMSMFHSRKVSLQDL